MKMSHIVIVSWPWLVFIASVLRTAFDRYALVAVKILGVVKSRTGRGFAFLGVDKWT